MISPTQLMKRLGVGGGLVPFAQSVCVYFAAGGGAPSAAAAAAKVAPVLSLLLFVMLQQPSTPHQARYGRLVGAGLSLSALGDLLLVWPSQLCGGMAAFGAAHAAYVAAFGLRPLRPALAALCYTATAAYLTLLDPPGVLRWVVPLYAVCVSSAAWRGAAGGGRGAGGALLFLASDALLAYHLFARPLPYAQVAVMSTYYLGQLGIALSVLDAPALAA